MECVWEFLNKNNGALMVIITFVYVIATILIFIANLISANSSKKQIAETKQQFNETIRIDNMPLINLIVADVIGSGYCMELDITKNAEGELISRSIQFVFENIGKGIAKNIKCKYISSIVEMEKIIDIPVLLTKENESVRVVLCAKPNAVKGSDSLTALFEIDFEDIFENKYLQKIKIEYFLEKEHKQIYIEKQIFAPKIIG